MKKRIAFLVLCNFLVNSLLAQTAENINFDRNWCFHLGGYAGGERTDVQDSDWRKVDLPHDWSIEDRSNTKSPFNAAAIGQVSQGFTIQGTAWYRKHFLMPTSKRGKRIVIQFDGVYMNSNVYVNGQLIGNHPYGYTSFYYDITDKVKFGEKNVIAVEVINEGQNSRWYSGSGIYRHVWLQTKNPIHFSQWSTVVTTPRITPDSAKCYVRTHLRNESKLAANLNLNFAIYGTDGTQVAQAVKKIIVESGKDGEGSISVEIPHPQLWSPELPNLYRVVIKAMQDTIMLDNDTTEFGIRKISFDFKAGIQLNNQTIKLKGGCIHHDNGPLGAAAYDRAEERKVEILKANGYNAVRCSHNPPSPAFLRACDKLGLLVIDEAFDAWNYGKNPYDYHLYFKDWWQKDMESMITRDRNHPSIIMWSIGNEIPERADSLGVNTAKMLVRFAKQLDSTRAITSAVNDASADKDPFFSTLEIAGYNYAIGGNNANFNMYVPDNKRIPKRIMLGTESYPLLAFENWMAVKENPFLIGDFVWTAIDYIGEASIGWRGYPQTNGFYPWNLAYCGDIDICGWKRPQSFYRDALWKQNQLAIFVTAPTPTFKNKLATDLWCKWNWPDVVPEWDWKNFTGRPLAVTVYSSCEEVELFLNGKSLGKLSTNRATKFMATWNVPYKDGELKAIGYTENKKVTVASLKTPGQPVMIKLIADRTHILANNEDLSYITVQLIDRNGNLCQKDDKEVSFSIDHGDATIAGVGNGNPISIESYQVPQRKTWKGKCLVIVKAKTRPGNIIFTASAMGLKTSHVILKSE